MNAANKRAYESAQRENAQRAKAQHLQFQLDDAQAYLAQLCDAWERIPLSKRAQLCETLPKFTNVFQHVYGAATAMIESLLTETTSTGGTNG